MAAIRSIATKAGLKLADYVVTEAGFGADLGAEKFFDIKCREAGLKPAACVIVATVRALKIQRRRRQAGARRRKSRRARGAASPISSAISPMSRKFGVPVVVAINRFASDTEAEHELIARDGAREVRRRGGRLRPLGAGLAGRRGARAAGRRAGRPARRADFACSMTMRRPLWDKVRTIATRDLRRRRHRRRCVGPPPVSQICRRRATARCRSASPRRPIPSRPIRPARRAERTYCAGPRPAPQRRRRLRRRPARRHPDHARPSPRSRRRSDQAERRAASRGCFEGFPGPAGVPGDAPRFGGLKLTIVRAAAAPPRA